MQRLLVNFDRFPENNRALIGMVWVGNDPFKCRSFLLKKRRKWNQDSMEVSTSHLMNGVYEGNHPSILLRPCKGLSTQETCQLRGLMVWKISVRALQLQRDKVVQGNKPI